MKVEGKREVTFEDKVIVTDNICYTRNIIRTIAEELQKQEPYSHEGPEIYRPLDSAGAAGPRYGTTQNNCRSYENWTGFDQTTQA